MTIKELIKKLNDCSSNGKISTVFGLKDRECDLLNYVKFRKVASNIDRDEHRWYVLVENVYKVSLEDGIHYLGVWEVGTLKSEKMSMEDCDRILEFYEMEQVPSVTYRRKQD